MLAVAASAALVAPVAVSIVLGVARRKVTFLACSWKGIGNLFPESDLEKLPSRACAVLCGNPRSGWHNRSMSSPVANPTRSIEPYVLQLTAPALPLQRYDAMRNHVTIPDITAP